MWIFLSDAFFSIVAKPNCTDQLVVRARRPGDIERVFPSAEVVTIPGRDYQFRAYIDRTTVAEAMYRKVQTLSHTNFKDSVREPQYHSACSAVWHVMAKLQPIPPYSYARNPRQNNLDY